MASPSAALHRFLSAVEDRDLAAIGACFTPTASYANIPHPAAVGRARIVALFEPIISRAERVEWVLRAEAEAGELAFAERLDRFWIDGREFSIECNGVYRVDATTGRLAEVRDYCDLGVWRTRLGNVLTPERDALGGPRP